MLKRPGTLQRSLKNNHLNNRPVLRVTDVGIPVLGDFFDDWLISQVDHQDVIFFVVPCLHGSRLPGKMVHYRFNYNEWGLKNGCNTDQVIIPAFQSGSSPKPSVILFSDYTLFKKMTDFFNRNLALCHSFPGMARERRPHPKAFDEHGNSLSVLFALQLILSRALTLKKCATSYRRSLLAGEKKSLASKLLQDKAQIRRLL